MMTSLINNIRFGLRQMRRSPGFAMTVVLTMALGVGANVIVFGVLNALVLHPLHLPDSDRLVFLNKLTKGGDAQPSQSYPDYRELRDKNSVFSGLTVSHVNIVGVEYGGKTAKSWMYESAGNYFDVLGAQPMLGRFFHSTDEHGPNSCPYVVLSYNYWRSQLNGDTAIVGKVINVNKHPFTVLGVAPQGFTGTELFFHPDMWIPIVNEVELEGYNYLDARDNHSLWVVGRMKPGVTVAEAQANLNAIGLQLSKQYRSDDGLAFSLSKPGFLGDMLGKPIHAFLYGVMLLAGLVLLAACANLGSLFAARAADRARELAVRMALGSTRGHILRQLVTEALLLSLLGGGLGLAGGGSVLAALSRWQPIPDFPVQLAVGAGPLVYALAFVLAVLCGVFFGMVPAMQVLRGDPYHTIKSGQAAISMGRRWSLRDVLLMVQIVLCSVIVTASLVAVRGLMRTVHTSYGFQPAGVTLTSFDLKMAGYTDEQSVQFQHRAMDAVAELPGVTAAGVVNLAPLGLSSSDASIFRDGTTDLRSSNAVTYAYYYSISPGYLGAAQTHLLRGRDFTWHDDKNSPSIAIINENFAKTVFGTVDAVGRYFIRGDKRIQVVGVAENGKYQSITEDPKAAMFFPYAQDFDSQTVLVIRSNGDAAQTSAAISRILKGMDAGLPFSMTSWPQALTAVQFPAVAATFALGVMGLLAAMLALTGIFGMASYTVSRRLRELGIRMALGAQRAQVLRAALWRPVQLLVIGSVGGLLLGVLSSRVLASIVYQATPRDPVVLVGVLLAMALIGLVAAWIPAQRALAVEPSLLLREE